MSAKQEPVIIRKFMFVVVCGTGNRMKLTVTSAQATTKTKGGGWSCAAQGRHYRKRMYSKLESTGLRYTLIQNISGGRTTVTIIKSVTNIKAYGQDLQSGSAVRRSVCSRFLRFTKELPPEHSKVQHYYAHQVFVS